MWYELCFSNPSTVLSPTVALPFVAKRYTPFGQHTKCNQELVHLGTIEKWTDGQWPRVARNLQSNQT